MDHKEQISQLLEEAAATITLLDVQDTQEVRAFEEILGQLSSAAQQAAQADEQLKVFYALSREAAECVRQLTTAGSKDVEARLDTLNASVMEMQRLLEQASYDSSGSQAAAAAEVVFSQDDIPLIQDFIAESREHIESAEAALLELENNPKNNEVLNQIFRCFHTIKGMAGFLNLNAINGLAHAAENLLDMARKEQLLLTGTNCDAVFSSIDMLKSMLVDLEKAIESGSGVSEPAGLSALLEHLHTCADGQAETASTPPNDPVLDEKTDQTIDTLLDTPAKETEKKNGQTTAGGIEKIKVNTTKLDDLINMTGELAIAQLMIAEEVKQSVQTDSALFRKVAQQNKIVRELQELSMSMRMVPIQGAFQKMSRLVRDLSKKAGKNVRLITSGEETELDRNIVEKITDPLVHMMRNSVDHGIETPEERKAKGKPPQGTVRLSASHQAGSILIEIEDDGRGLRREKLIQKAVEKGLISAHQELSDQEVFGLIFQAGFSTAEKISDVSGRGVGMDVVRKNIESLGGKIDIQSTPDAGTTFLIRLPLTLAIIDGQIVTIADQRYIIPINSIVGSVRPTGNQIRTVQDRGEVALIRGELIPLVRLGSLFSVSGGIQEPSEALLVVVEEGCRRCALLVDDLLGQQQVVIKNLSGLGKIKGISGGAIMGDGRISLILDVPGLIDLSQDR
jgi:two-component system chemotaxis sensor kinase CheA